MTVFPAIFRFLQTQSFKRLTPFDVLAPVNQSYKHDRTAFETFLNPPTYIPTLVRTCHDWLIFIQVIIGVLIDRSKNIELCLCSVPMGSENRSNSVK